MSTGRVTVCALLMAGGLAAMPLYGSAPSFFTASGVIFGAALVALAWAALQFTLRNPAHSSRLEKSNAGG